MEVIETHGDDYTTCKAKLIGLIEDKTAAGMIWVRSVTPYRRGSQFVALAFFIPEDPDHV